MDKFGIEPLPLPFKVYSNIQTVTVGSFLDSTNPAWGTSFTDRIDIDFIPDIITLKQLNFLFIPVDTTTTTEQIFMISSNLVPNSNLASFPVVSQNVHDGANIIRTRSRLIINPNFNWFNKSNNRIQGNYYFQVYSLTNDTFNIKGYLSLTFEFIKY